MMGELVAWARGVLTFDSATYSAHVASRDALKRGLLLMVIVALLTGLFPFLSSVVGSFREPDLAAIERTIEKQIDQSMQFNPAWQDPTFRRVFQDNFQMGFAIGKDIAQLKPNASFLPNWLERLLHALGEWLSLPFTWLGAWAGYALWVMLAARLLGGRATLPKMLGATLVFVLPHALGLVTGLLDLMSRIPNAGTCFGLLSWLIGFAAWIWGIAIYVKATATANEFGLGKATLATILPALLALLLAFLLLFVIVILALVGSAR